MHAKIGFTIGGLTLTPTILAAAEFNQWPPLIIGSAIGTVAVLFSVWHKVEDTRYTTLLKRFSDSDEENTAKIDSLKELLEQSEDDRRHLRHEILEVRRLLELAECPVSEGDKARCSGMSEPKP